MTIQEAIQSGRPFKRPSFETYIICPGNKDIGLKWDDFPKDGDPSLGKFWPREEDLLATDWEIQMPAPMRVWLKEDDLKKLFAPGSAYYVQGVTIFRDNRTDHVSFVECPDTAIVLTPSSLEKIIGDIMAGVCFGKHWSDLIREAIFPKGKK